MGGPETPKGIFISYRRADAASAARLLYAELIRRFQDGRTFMDVSSIEPGADFLREIDVALADCAVLVALIGPRWMDLLAAIDPRSDYVRHEIREATERGLRIIPVLVDGATPLRPEHLPADLLSFARLNAVELRHTRHDADMDALSDVIRQARIPAPGRSVPLAPYPNGAVPAGMTRTRRLLTDAAKAASAMSHSDRARGRALVAEALAPIDPRASEALLTEMTRTGHVREVVEVLAARDPWRAEQIARSTIKDDFNQGAALWRVVREMVATDLTQAERIADTIRNETWRASALLEVVIAVAPKDPRRAEIIAQWIAADSIRKRAQAVIEVSTLDEWPQLERLLKDQDSRGLLSTRLLDLKVIDPDRALDLAKTHLRLVPTPVNGSRAVVDRDQLMLVWAVAGKDLQIGIRMAEKLEDGGRLLVGAILRRVAGSDPRHAARILRELPPGWRDPGAVAAVGVGLAAEGRTDPAKWFEEAELIALRELDPVRPRALAMVARELSRSEPARSVKIADDAEHHATHRSDARDLTATLVDIAKLDPAYPEPPVEPWLPGVRHR